MVLKKNGNFTRCLKCREGLLAFYTQFSIFKSNFNLFFLNIDTNIIWVLFEYYP